MSATFVLESRPPLRKAPIGTSLISRLATDRSINSRTRSTLSAPFAAGQARPSERRPVALGAHRAVRLAAEQVRGRQLEDVLEHRERRGGVGERQKAVEGDRIDVARDIGMLEQRLDLGGEQRIVRRRSCSRAASCRADRARAAARAAARPRAQTRTSRRVRDTHARAGLLVGVDDDLGVGPRLEHVASRRRVGRVRSRWL